MIAVNEMVVPKTSLARANIDGYPSTVIVEEGNRHKEFPTEGPVPTNSFPALHDVKVMEQLIRGDGPVTEEPKAEEPKADDLKQKRQGIFDFVPNVGGGKKQRKTRKNRKQNHKNTRKQRKYRRMSQNRR